MSSNIKTVDRETQEEMVGILTAISIVSKRMASRLIQLGEKEATKKSTEPDDEVKV